ncbi:hypothetical protein D3C76_459230 [compost metagenome]
MKKFITGIVVGALLFGAVPAFAAQVKSLVGQKVTAEYTVTVNGKTLEDKGIVVNGRTNAPVRAISDAIGADLKVEGKTIAITTESAENAVQNDSNSETIDDINVLKSEHEKISSEITKHENAIKTYEEKYIPSAERAINATIFEENKLARQQELEKYQNELETLKSELADLQKQLAEIEVQIAELQK